MEQITLFLPKTTVELMHLIARQKGDTIGGLLQDMAMERYMKDRMGLRHTAVVIEGNKDQLEAL
ncbi:hypothetical protein [Celeribacter sp.]|uniref:hypothetical protein n=1 Tax=Celeribacter sp. TaxID=1890673 RepID=UPI003A92D9CE